MLSLDFRQTDQRIARRFLSISDFNFRLIFRIHIRRAMCNENVKLYSEINRPKYKDD